MKIRKFKKIDAKETSGLIKKALTQVNSKDYPQSLIKALCREYNRENLISLSIKKEMYVACGKRKILGTVSLDNQIISTVFVNPENFLNGIGTKLMNYAEERIREKGYKTAKLKASVTAYEFYKKRGYKTIKEIFSEESGKNILMSKRLKQ